MLRISCLHTAESNIAVFEAARRQLKLDDVMLKHRVRSDLLARAEAAGGATPEILEQAGVELRSLARGAHALLLTCSTIGRAIELVGDLRMPALRVDEALATEAVRGGGTVVVLCTVASTITSTRALFEAAAPAGETEVELRIVPEAWPAFKAGDLERYHRLIAAAADTARRDGATRVALAQSSMAPALAFCHEQPLPLTSPVAGLRAILAAVQAATEKS